MSVLQFMTFRMNVNFDGVYLQRKSKIGLLTCAECYLQDIEPVEEPRSVTTCLTFNMLSNRAEELLRIIATKNSDNVEYAVEFIGESRKDANLISGQKIRDVCTSIELECSFENFMNIPVRRSRLSGVA